MLSIILNIDTAAENATISIAEDGVVENILTNDVQKNHAAFLQPAIKHLLEKSKLSMRDLHAVAVTAGPGSYTGLRVGMASAKGLCYALKIPLIAVSTLEVMALGVMTNTAGPDHYLYCPMLEAGRMEVFTAVYDDSLNPVILPCAMILEGDSFNDVDSKRKIIFSGSGAKKFQEVCDQSRCLFADIPNTASALALLSFKKFGENLFVDVHNASPTYIKQFYTISKSTKT